nr:hypothetical protein [Bacteroidales bacterium]
MSWKKKADGNDRIRVTQDEYDFLQQYRKLKENAYGKVEEEGTKLVVTSRLAQSIEDITKEYNIDTSLWECVHFKPGNWTTPVKGKFNSDIEKDGKQIEQIRATIPIMMENRKSEARFEKRTSIIDYSKFRRDLVKDLFRHSQKIPLKKYKRTDSGNVLEVNVPDLHLGKQSWAEETG